MASLARRHCERFGVFLAIHCTSEAVVRNGIVLGHLQDANTHYIYIYICRSGAVFDQGMYNPHGTCGLLAKASHNAENHSGHSNLAKKSM